MLSLLPIALGLALTVQTAWGDDQTETEPNAATTAPAADEVAALPVSPGDRLKNALNLYQRGDAPKAQGALARFINDPSMEDERLRQRARVYLGEVLYQQQNEEEARRVFEAVLTLDPNYTIDPFAHPPDVCGFFETVRAYIVPVGTKAAQAPPAPIPSSAYMGFGVYHFQSGETGSGTKIAIAQTTAGVISLVTFASLLEDRRYLATPGTLEALNLRRGLQWGATAAFYGIWAWSISDSKRHWRANVGLEPPRSSNRTGETGGLPGLHLGLTFPTY